MLQFGTGGWRAVIADGFTKANLRLLAAGLCRLMDKEGLNGAELCIGYDRRFLSKESAHWLAEVIAANGCRVLMINRSSPTPLIMYTVKTMNMPYGLMVTASHNPAIYNGIKVFTYGGRDANEVQTGEIEAFIREAEKEGPAEALPYEKAKEQGLVIEFNPLNEYLDNIIDHINMKAIREKGMHVVLDPMYGVSQTSLKVILSTARCELDIIHGAHDTLFGRRMPAPSEKSLTELATYVTEMDCDLGIATDGDADRLGVVDDLGRYLHANDILVMLYYYLLKYRGWRGPAVRNVATTHVLDRMAEDYGQVCYEVPVGFKHISAKMSETGAIIGGESSGGLTVQGHINGKDGIYAGMLLIEMIAVAGKRLSQIRDEIDAQYGRHYMEEQSLRFPAERKAELTDLLMVQKKLPDFGRVVPDKHSGAEYKTPEIGKVSYMDGCKVYFTDGSWVIARFSGTEPLLRIFCETENPDKSKAVCDLFAGFLGL